MPSLHTNTSNCYHRFGKVVGHAVQSSRALPRSNSSFSLPSAIRQRGLSTKDCPGSSAQRTVSHAQSWSASGTGQAAGRGPRTKRAGPTRAPAPDSEDFFSSTPISQLEIDEKTKEALANIGVTRASHVQAAAWKAWGSGARHILVADHAGSGKTLAYLTPIIQDLKAEEKAQGKRVTSSDGPRALVVVPTRELGRQVHDVAKSLCKTQPLRVALFTGSHTLRAQKKMVQEGIDVLVATPGRLRDLAEAGHISLERCRAVVMDEVDVLLGDMSEFRDIVLPIRDLAGKQTRFLFATATIPEHCLSDLAVDFEGLVPAVGRNLHRPAPGALVLVVDCSGGTEINEETGFARKAEALLEAMSQVPAARTLIFCNKIETCRQVENLLRRKAKGLGRVLACHAAIREDVREANMDAFLERPTGPADRLALVCTDRASRGMDSSFVEHVVLFDFPRDPSEYIRRVGRTARGAGGKGLVTALVLGRQVPLAKEIVQRNSKGLPVHRVPDAEDFSFGARTFLMEHGVVEVAPQGWEGRSGDDMDFFEIE